MILNLTFKKTNKLYIQLLLKPNKKTPPISGVFLYNL